MTTVSAVAVDGAVCRHSEAAVEHLGYLGVAQVVYVRHTGAEAVDDSARRVESDDVHSHVHCPLRQGQADVAHSHDD